MEIFWSDYNQSNVDFKVLSWQNFHGWSILFSKMLQTAFAVFSGANKVHRLLDLQDFLTGSVRRVGPKQR